MDNKHEILSLLRDIKEGNISPESALTELKMNTFEDLGYAKVDYHRSIRQGASEVIYGEGKTAEHITGILKAMTQNGCKNILITRLDSDKAKEISKEINMNYTEIARIAVANPVEIPLRGQIVIATGGTSDISVAEEAAITAESQGNKVLRLYDVGVAGIHRLLKNVEIFANARCVIAVAGMEGALPSVVGGLVDCPVVAVPTSVGYGASFGGLSALLSMLNSCSSGVSVVNIDNGFGAGFLAGRINQMEGIIE